MEKIVAILNEREIAILRYKDRIYYYEEGMCFCEHNYPGSLLTGYTPSVLRRAKDAYNKRHANMS